MSLPVRDAFCFREQSKRWRHTWTTIPTLILDYKNMFEYDISTSNIHKRKKT
ncbi:hypothetical protein QJS04_geneDACA010139 [Acorus gramineus]|uniref:Uncharacterized protein n=1 Tax=Acorus gramineus TaxID=55184 RepID=A0AAV9A7H8_ACOGR|nr:hypothetical protein QJS04_geneDACA010139 [Acorus gramineus]